MTKKPEKPEALERINALLSEFDGEDGTFALFYFSDKHSCGQTGMVGNPVEFYKAAKNLFSVNKQGNPQEVEEAMHEAIMIALAATYTDDELLPILHKIRSCVARYKPTQGEA